MVVTFHQHVCDQPITQLDEGARLAESLAIRLSNESKQIFGKQVLFYRLTFSGTATAQLQQSLDIPVVRFPQALRFMFDTYTADRQSAQESFAAWGMRKNPAFFTELLENFNLLSPDDLPELLQVNPLYHVAA